MRMRQQALQDEEDKMKRKQNRCSSSRTITPTKEVEYRDICSTSFSGLHRLQLTQKFSNVPFLLLDVVIYYVLCLFQCRHTDVLSKKLNAVHRNLHALPRLACALSILGITGMLLSFSLSFRVSLQPGYVELQTLLHFYVKYPTSTMLKGSK